MRRNHTHCASAANKNRLLTFCNKDFYRITSLPSHFSLPSFQNQRKTSLGFENITWCQGKISQFRFKHLFWRFKIMLTGSFIAHKISHMYSCELWDLLWGFFSEGQEWCRWCLLMFGHYIQISNYTIRKQLICQESTDHSFLTAQWEIKKYWIPMSTFSVENHLKCQKMYFWPIFFTLSSYFPCLVPL